MPAAIMIEPPHPLAFTADEVRRAIATGGQRRPDPTQDNRPTATLAGPGADWLYDRLLRTVLPVVQECFGMVPSSVGNYSYGKVLEYPAGMGGMAWHTDNAVDRTEFERAILVARGDMEPWQFEEMEGRTVSCMVQLSPSDAYEGGDLELRNHAGQAGASRELGALVIAPADTEHQVLPVTWGSRISLVMFFGWSPRGP